MFTLISWFILCFGGGLITLWAVWSRAISKWRRLTIIGFLFWVFVSGGALLVSQGWSTPCYLLLPGSYNLIGFLPVPETTIYLFLDTQYGPKTCDIPWDSGKADELQKNQEGAGTEIVVGGEGNGNGILGISEGGVTINDRPPASHDVKPAETPPMMM